MIDKYIQEACGTEREGQRDREGLGGQRDREIEMLQKDKPRFTYKPRFTPRPRFTPKPRFTYRPRFPSVIDRYTDRHYNPELESDMWKYQWKRVRQIEFDPAHS